MKFAYLDPRKNPARPRTTVTLALPDDMIADMERIAPYFACDGAISLIRLYAIKGLRESLEYLDKPKTDGPRDATREQWIRKTLQAAAENTVLSDADKRHLSDLPLENILAITRKATRNAAREALRAGRAVTGMRDGEIVTYQPGDLLDVVAVEARPGYLLQLEFGNGEKRVFDMTPYLGKGVFRQLQDAAIFQQAYIDYGTVCWPGHIDIAPETLYERSRPGE